MKSLAIACACACVFISGCSTQPAPPISSLVYVPSIIGSLKCAFATALMREKDVNRIKRLEKNIAVGKLILKVVHKTTDEFGVKGGATAPFVLSFAGGTASIMPAFSNSVIETNTITTTINFRYYLWALDKNVCDSGDVGPQAAYGFSGWLASVIDGLDKNAYQYPLGKVDSVNYAADFGVVATTKAGVDFDVVFVSGSASATKERNDVQSIEFKILTPSKENPAPDIWDGTFSMTEKLQPPKQPPAKKPSTPPKPPGVSTTPGGVGPATVGPTPKVTE